MKTFENKAGENTPSNYKMPPDNGHRTMITFLKKDSFKN